MNQFIFTILFAFVFSLIGYPFFIPILKIIKFGQNIREDGPQAHLSKKGTPIMGGIGIVTTVIVTFLIFGELNLSNLMILWLMVGFGLVGFSDDYLKVVKKNNLGLRAWQKMTFQGIITLGYIVTEVMYNPDFGQIILPFTHGKSLSLSFLTIPFMIIFILGTVNSVNIIDGLDGLSTSVTSIVAIFFTFAAWLYKLPTPTVSLAIIGALLGFLVFNCYPARVFMGDTGSLALGGYVAGISLALDLPLFILIAGLIYFIDILSVMIQVAVYKRTKKRVFKMAPIHHHFELIGWHETKVVAYFTIFTVVACLIGVIAL